MRVAYTLASWESVPALTTIHQDAALRARTTIRRLEALRDGTPCDAGIVLPVELRRTMDIAEKDPLEIYVDGNSIVLRKYRPSCIFCDSTKDVRTFRGKNVCPRCLRELRERT